MKQFSDSLYHPDLYRFTMKFAQGSHCLIMRISECVPKHEVVQDSLLLTPKARNKMVMNTTYINKYQICFLKGTSSKLRNSK